MRECYMNINDIRNNPNESWDLFWLSCNKQVTVKDIESLKLPNSKNNWDWNNISQCIHIREVRNHPNQSWNKFWLSHNKRLTVKDVETLQLPNSVGNWDWSIISTSIDINEVINNPNKPWDKYGLSCNNGITGRILEFFDMGLLKHLQKNIGEFTYGTDISIKCE